MPTVPQSSAYVQWPPPQFAEFELPWLAVHPLVREVFVSAYCYNEPDDPHWVYAIAHEFAKLGADHLVVEQMLRLWAIGHPRILVEKYVAFAYKQHKRRQDDKRDIELPGDLDTLSKRAQRVFTALFWWRTELGLYQPFQTSYSKLMRELRLKRNTLIRALKELEDKDFLERVPGRVSSDGKPLEGWYRIVNEADRHV